MTLLFTSSFDGGDNTSAFGKWSNAPTTPTVNATNPRFAGSNAFSIGGTALGSGNLFRQSLGTAGEHATVIVGAAHRWESVLTGADNSTVGLMAFRSDAGVTIHLVLTCTATGELRVRRGSGSGTILGTSAAGVFTADAWHYVEMKAVLSDTVGTVDVQIDGVNVLTLTGLDTKNAGTKTVFDQVEFGTGLATAHRLRDVYICNGAGTVNNDFLGDCRVTFLAPDVDSTPEEWTTSTGTSTFALVDDNPPNDDTDYIESSTDGQISRVGLAALTDTTHSVFGVQVATYAKKDDAGDRSFRTGVFSDATLADQADHALSTSYVTYRDVVELDPDGAVAWTPTAVNAAFVQVEVRP